MNTIHRGRELGSVRAAISDTPFLKSLHRTLEAWGIGTRASRLCAYEKFAAALRDRTSVIAALDGERAGVANEMLIWITLLGMMGA